MNYSVIHRGGTNYVLERFDKNDNTTSARPATVEEYEMYQTISMLLGDVALLKMDCSKLAGELHDAQGRLLAALDLAPELAGLEVTERGARLDAYLAKLEAAADQG